MATIVEALEEPADASIVEVSQSPDAIAEQILAELQGRAHADMGGSASRRKAHA
jgi:hypothetical protein